MAASAPWHELHDAAFDALAGRPAIIAHAAFETYSTLTRMPEPNRVHPAEALLFLEDWFGDRWLGLPASAQQLLVGRLADAGIFGGATYDALIAATALAEQATLVSCDRRALSTYERIGVEIELIG